MGFGFNEVTLSHMSKSSNTATSENLEAQCFSWKVFKINYANEMKRHLSVLFIVSFSFQNKVCVGGKTET